jgi:hypothetical protein
MAKLFDRLVCLPGALMSFEGTRPHMDARAQKRLRSFGEHAPLDYRREKNATSIDGLPALQRPIDA